MYVFYCTSDIDQVAKQRANQSFDMPFNTFKYCHALNYFSEISLGQHLITDSLSSKRRLTKSIFIEITTKKTEYFDIPQNNHKYEFHLPTLEINIQAFRK